MFYILSKRIKLTHLKRKFSSSIGLDRGLAKQIIAPSVLNNSSRFQFSKDNITDFGELPLGEIPEALKYDRPFNITQLPNGIRVATEYWESPLATVSVFINCGSRDETIETSGVAHFLEHLHFKGTTKRTRVQLELDVENMGGQLNAYTSRENTSYTMTVFVQNTNKAVEILGDMLINSLYNKNQVESERETIYRECLETSKDQLETTIENSHYTSYRDSMMGQPILGSRENIGLITQDMIKQFHQTHYYGNNIIVVGAGGVKQEQLVELVGEYFGKLQQHPPAGLKPIPREKGCFTPSMMMIRDDEMANVNIGVFIEAPDWSHPHYYAFLLFQRILGEYRADTHTENKQYNSIHTQLSQLPEVAMQKTIYAPYSDTGMFGSYLLGNDNHGFQMLYLSQLILSEYAYHLSTAEVYRAKNKLYNELLQHETGNDISQSIGNQLLYLNRRVPRSEIAQRVSSITPKFLQRVATHWFFDRDVSVVCWGPVEQLMVFSNYNRPIRRSLLGWQGTFSEQNQ